jgi:16S rRNA G966 N2-methylase RsmD
MQQSLFETPKLIQKPKKIMRLRIPYQGSKSAISDTLLDKMLEIKPNAKYFYDLTAGGGSLSFMALQYGLQVHYNEFHTPLANFMKFIIERIKNGERSKYGIFPEEFYNWVSREQFFEAIKKDNEFSQFCRICYSFGNNGKDYLFGKPIENQKRLLHNIVMFQCEKSLKELNDTFGTHYTISNKPTFYERMLEYKTEWNAHIKENACFQEMVSSGFIKNHQECTSAKKKEWLQKQEQCENLERLVKLESLKIIDNIGRVQLIDELHKIELLKRPEQIETIEKLNSLPHTDLAITNLSYEMVKITTPPEESILYIDPPYRNTGGYVINKNNTFDHEALDKWFIESPYTVFMSEYNAPHKCIFEIPKMKLFQNKGLDKRPYTIEKLFWNGK